MSDPLSASVQRWTVIVAAGLAQIFILTNTEDPVNVTKMTLVLLAAIILLAAMAVRSARDRAVTLPAGLPGYSAGAFAVALLIATSVAQATGTALWGNYLRNAGLFLYLAGLMLFVTVAWIGDTAFLRKLVFVLVGVGALLSFYSLLQHFSVDPIPWQIAYSNPVSTFGNPDFAGAFYAIALPLAVWAALWSRVHVAWRVVCGGVAVLLLIGIQLSGAAQGYVGAAAALFLLLLGWLLTRPPELRRRGLVAWGAVALVGVGLLLAGLANTGPLARLGGTGAVSIRRHFWRVAWSMFTHHPVAGLGMSMYNDYFRAFRSQAVVNALGATDAPDAPHSVPIAMFANGGFLLGLSYLAFVVAVAIALVRALRRGDAAAVMLTAAVGAAWLAYQVESTVSVDVPPIVALHFILAGAVVARSPSPTRALFARAGASGGRPSPDFPRVVAGVATVAAIVLGWFAIQPLRADAHAHAAASATARGDAQAALANLEHATAEAGWQPVYWRQRAIADGAVGQTAAGLEDLRHGLNADPRDIDTVLSFARVEAAVHDDTAAQRYYRIAISLDPLNPTIRAELAKLTTPAPTPAG